MFKGSIVAIVTPFHNDLTINYEKFKELLVWHVQQGTNGIVVCGTTGEATTLHDEEKIKLFKIAVEIINKKIPVIAGCGSNDTAHSLYLSQQAKNIGVDGLLLINPYYNKCNSEGMYLHFAEVAKNVDLPIMLYNVPSRTGNVIPISIIDRLSKEFNNIVAIKDAGGDLNYSLKIIGLNRLTLLCGDDNLTIAMMSIGAEGVVSVAANILPKEYAAMCRLYQEGNNKNALDIQLKYQNFVEKLFIEVNPIPIKAAMNIKGLDVGGYRLPLSPMSKTNLKILEEAMEII